MQNLLQQLRMQHWMPLLLLLLVSHKMLQGVR
jgi:hypothetical protein